MRWITHSSCAVMATTLLAIHTLFAAEGVAATHGRTDGDRTAALAERLDEIRPVSLVANIEDSHPPSGSLPADDVQQADIGSPSSSANHDLAMKLQNPIADLISIPFQSNFDFGGGVDGPPPRRTRFLRNVAPHLLPSGPARLADKLFMGTLGKLDKPDRDQAFRYLLNFQPVIPITLSKDWNVISRTILPVAYQDDVRGVSSQGGMGDILQSFFLSPRKPVGGWILGAGPAMQIPTGTDDAFRTKQFSLGPTGVALRQEHGWTYGMLANHLWHLCGSDEVPDVDATFLQPFLVYTFKSNTSIGLNTETTYDWNGEQWTVPLNGFASQLVRIGKLPVQFQVGGRYYLDAPDGGPDWGLRFTVTFLLPK